MEHFIVKPIDSHMTLGEPLLRMHQSKYVYSVLYAVSREMFVIWNDCRWQLTTSASERIVAQLQNGVFMKALDCIWEISAGIQLGNIGLTAYVDNSNFE